MIDPELANDDSQRDGTQKVSRCLHIECDHDNTPRGVYLGGLIVLGQVELSEPHSVIDQEKPLDARERTTLLTIIGALADAANIDLSQHNKAGEAVAAMLAAKGVTLSGRTIGEHLKAVREAMDSRKVK